MREIVRKLFCVLLVACMVLSVPMAFAEDADQLIEENILNYVIVLDCSYSGNSADKDNLCQEACEAFIDSLPEEDCRLALVTFGYQEKQVKVESDLDQVHVEIPLTLLEASDRSTRDRYRQQYLKTVAESLEFGRNNRHSFTPIGQALQVSMDLLEDAKVLPENAVIVLITDGVHEPLSGGKEKYIDSKDRTPDIQRLETAVGRAADKKWPICSVELNYNLTDRRTIAAADKLLDQISERNLPRDEYMPALTRISCASPEEVVWALDQVLRYSMGLPPVDPEEIMLPYDYPFTVEPLTSEFSLKIVGAGLERVTLTNNDTGETLGPVAGDMNQDRLIARVKPGRYTVIKMICPTEGSWTAHMEGQGGVLVKMSWADFQDMGLKMTATPKRADADPRKLHKTDEIVVNAVFYYQDIEENNSSFYAQQNATLLLTDASRVTREIPLQGDQSGYHATLGVSDYPSGEITLQVLLRHPMFRNGIKYSNRVSLHTVNEPVQDKAGRPDTVERSAFVNTAFDQIDLNELFVSPDGDPYIIELVCDDDRSIKFSYDEDALKDDYLLIPVGDTLPGTYHLTIQARDEDMAVDNYCSYSGLILTVENHPPVTVDKLRNLELWTDKYFFQKKEVGPVQLILPDYFQDPDGLPLRYEILGADESVLAYEISGDLLTLTPKGEGKVTLTVAAIDSGNDRVEQSMKVTSTSGKASFWRHNWIYFVIGLAVLAAIVLFIVVVMLNRRMKGQWIITFEDQEGNKGETAPQDIAHFTAVGKKRKFLFLDLMDELSSMTAKSGINWGRAVGEYFGQNSGTGLDKMLIYGAMSKQGCTLKKIPKNDRVKVKYNGVEVTGSSLKVRGGRFSVTAQNAQKTKQLTVTLRLQ